MKLDNLPGAARASVDVMSYGVAVATIADLLPPLAALLTILWTLINIFETKTVQSLLARLRKDVRGSVMASPRVARTLAGVLGSVTGATLLFTAIPAEESGRTVVATVAPATGAVTVRHVSGPQYLRAYLDIVKVPTACDGITRGVRLGQSYTEGQCTVLLERELIAHAEPVIRCVPGLYGREYQAAAAVSLAYNIGTAGFCRSTTARRFNAGDWREGCDAMLAWNKAGGRVVRGLQLRRARERALCLTGLA